MNRSKHGSSVARQIDENLKRAFDDLAAEEVPDRFRQILDQLRAQDIASKDTPPQKPHTLNTAPKDTRAQDMGEDVPQQMSMMGSKDQTHNA